MRCKLIKSLQNKSCHVFCYGDGGKQMQNLLPKADPYLLHQQKSNLEPADDDSREREWKEGRDLLASGKQKTSEQRIQEQEGNYREERERDRSNKT